MHVGRVVHKIYQFRLYSVAPTEEEYLVAFKTLV